MPVNFGNLYEFRHFVILHDAIMTKSTTGRKHVSGEFDISPYQMPKDPLALSMDLNE